MELLDAFVSLADDNKFVLLVDSLEHFCNVMWEKFFIHRRYIDIFTIDQNNVQAGLQDGETINATINCSKAVLVVLDERNYSLTRLRCLYEIGYTPIS